MKRLRQLVPVTAAALLTLLAAGASACLAQSVSANEMRAMTSTDFRRHIKEEGAEAFVHRFVKDVDPHSPEEPNYDIVLEHVAEGSPGWLEAAAEIAPFTDQTFSQGLSVAIADALVVNPAAVLKMIGSEQHFDEACGYPFVHQTDTYMLKHKREALAALTRVHQPALAEKKEQCRKQLQNVPTATASGAGRPLFNDHE